MTRELPTHAVKAVITDQAGGILFLQRNAAGRADKRSNWDLPGGLVELGEDDETALHREVPEETGCKAVSVGPELGRWSFYRPFDGATVEVTNYAVDLDEADLTLSDEHVALQWVSPETLRAGDLEVKDPSLFDALGLEK